MFLVSDYLSGDISEFRIAARVSLISWVPLLACPVPRLAGFSEEALLDKPAVAPGKVLNQSGARESSLIAKNSNFTQHHI